MLINGKRALAYIVAIDEIRPIPNYDRVEHARTNGWWVIVSKNDNLKVGDKCVYFEIDSRVPSDDPRFAFLEKRDFKVLTLKMCKVISQGLLMPVSAFGFDDLPVGTDVTEKLGITYAVDDDNVRKSAPNAQAKYTGMQYRHKKLFKTKLFRWLMRHERGRKFLFAIFGRKTDTPLPFPSCISHTDEERCENMPWILGTDIEYVATEKIDGTSSTYLLERKPFGKFDYTVCSRNLGLHRPKNEREADSYWAMEFKYNIEKHLKEYLAANPDKKFVCIQGEIAGPGIQKNPLSLDDIQLFGFNVIDDVNGRWPSYKGRELLESFGMQWVPVLGTTTLPATMEELKATADGNSALSPCRLREGIVYRSLNGKNSFKNVSNEYLLHQGKLKPRKKAATNE